ncbi:MAG: peptidoglycan DD-metalloendopeptidase family protein [Chloroflexi bacterium]|nr:peptidoglycan DD-metalloendopeptidase family protein [Chloroflexota bacterium]
MRRFLAAFSFPLFLSFAGLYILFAGLTFARAAKVSGGGLDSLIWPISGSSTPDTPAISSPFGPRWQASQSRYDYHPGIDIAAPQDTPIHAITDGVVSELGWLSNSAGLAIVVYHPSLDLYSAYLHLSRTATGLTLHQPVTQGQVIGYVGNSGTTDFMHLHFEIRLTATGYPTSTRNPLGYLPRPDVTTPTLSIAQLQSDPVYSPTVSLSITVPRAELDLNQIRVLLQDRATGNVLDDRFVDFNRRLHTGSDTLDQDGIRLRPAHFHTATQEYTITANFYDLHGFDSFTLTAQATDLGGHTATVTATAGDLTPPAPVTTLTAQGRADGGVDLRWIAPGDSDFVGTAASYDIRYAGVPINSFTWLSAVKVANSPAPLAGGQAQTMTLSGPLPTPAYFALKASDNEGNVSLLSNSAQVVWTVFVPVVRR